VFSIFLVATGTLLGPLLSARDSEAQVILSLIGLAAAVIGGAIVCRALGHLELQEQLIGDLEVELGIESKFSSVKLRNPDLFREKVDSRFPYPTRPIVTSGFGAICLAWLVAFIWFCIR
jgi:hypothetical protein